MKPQLVVSTFPGIDLLGRAFEEEGFWVLRGGDPIFGGDIRREKPFAGRVDGVIGGPPCQAFSRLAHMVRHNGYEPKFGNLIPEFERYVRETGCQWFIMEEVPDAPTPVVEGYGVHSFLLNNRQLGETQNRVRRISFGWRGERRVLMLNVVPIESPEFVPAAIGGSNSGKRKVRTGFNGKTNTTMPFNAKSAASFAEVKRKQGLPDDWDLPGWTVEGKCKAVGNGVPMAMGRALARAVREVIDGPASS